MDEIQKAIQAAQAERRLHIAGCFSNAADLKESPEDIHKAEDGNEEETAEETEEVSKAEETETEETAESAEDNVEEETEKSDIMYALGNGNIKVTKTGKEIKDQVDSVLLPELNAALAAKEVEATTKLGECGNAPTKDPDTWWTGDVKMDVGFKVYDWREREWCQNDGRMYPTLSASDEAEKKGNCPTSAAEAKAREEYNELVRCICNIKVDIKACEILKTLKDNTQYELTPRQVITLKF